MRFHVLGICHTVSSKEYLSCAFTQKVVKFCSMMMRLNPIEREQKKNMSTEELIMHKTIHYVIHYGHERSDVECDEQVNVMNDEILKKAYGDYDWKKEFFKCEPHDLAHDTFTSNTVVEVDKRKMPGDFILCFWGYGHKQIAEPFLKECLIVEPGIGYPPLTSFAPFKVYESYAVMHNHYGVLNVTHPSWYDCVIPNYFDPADFAFKKKKENYFLYLGRIIQAKGVDVILHLAKKMGFRLLIAGQGSIEKDLGEINLPANVQYIGFADVEKRKELMANAKALLIASSYIEPFGGVAVEAMISGTPIISCDWGVFNETVLHGLTGYRCRTIDQFEWAIRNIDKIDPQVCRDWAMSNYCLEKVRQMYEEYFDMLLKLKFNEGFTLEDPNRTELNWLYREYPNKSIISIEKKEQPKVLIITENKWEFCKIFQALQKYSKELDINILSLENGIPTKDKLDLYDLIYTAVWDISFQLELKYPDLKDKITFSIHGKDDFTKIQCNDFENLSIKIEEIKNCEINKQQKLIAWLTNRKLGFSVISNELYRLLLSSYKLKENETIYLTQCGVDNELFNPYKQEKKNLIEQPLKVICRTPLNSIDQKSQVYDDDKRKSLLEKIENKFKNEENNKIEFIFQSNFFSLEDISDFYRKGDVWLNISHDSQWEDNPIGTLEAGASGLAFITTKVGEMSQFINNGDNGFIISNDNDEEIEKETINYLTILYKNRSLLNKMKENIGISVKTEWTWKHRVTQWEAFFLDCLKKKLN